MYLAVAHVRPAPLHVHVCQHSSYLQNLTRTMVGLRTRLLATGAVASLLCVSEAFVRTPSRFSVPGSASPSVAEPESSTSLNGSNKVQDDRRRFVLTTSSVATLSWTALGRASPAAAKGGDAASMKVPGIGSYIDFLIEKNKEQQGTDVTTVAYQGADLETQLRRLSDAASRLTEIRDLAEEKKWSQVQGIITGPLGTLLQTMASVVSASGGNKMVKEAAGVVKADIIAIGQAATKKSVEGCIESADMTMSDLKMFVEIAFE